MKKQSLTTAIVIKTTIKNKNGKYPLLLRITYQKKQYFLRLRDTDGKTIEVTPFEFKQINSTKANNEQRTLKQYIADIEIKSYDVATKIIKENDYFSLDRFKDVFYYKQPESDPLDLFLAINERVKVLRAEERFSTATTYQYALNSLKQFTGTDKLNFDKCTPEFFKKYEKWFLAKGNSKTTIGIYLRNVRAIFNEKIDSTPPIISREIYPFGTKKNKKYVIPTGSSIKKAISLENMIKITNFRFNNQRDFYKDLFIFSYLCYGINIKDIANLKYSNIIDDFIYLERAKTINTNKEADKIEISIHKETGRILDKYGSKTGNYIFNIINDQMTAEQKHKAIQQMVKNINNALADVCELLELPKITTYTARHSFATILKRSGASYEFISECLGHSKLETTKSYLANFEQDKKREMTNKLL